MKTGDNNSRAYLRLSEFFFTCKKRDVNFSIAKTLILKINDFPDIFIEEIAYLAQTTPASVSKFCKKIGYATFSEMKNDILLFQHNQLFADTDQMALAKGLDEAYHYFMECERAIMDRYYDFIDKEQMKRIGKRLHQSQKIAVLSNTYSFYVANTLRDLLRTKGITVFEVNRDADDELIASVVDSADLVIAVSFTEKWLRERESLLARLQKAEKPQILITQSSSRSYAQYFCETINFEGFDDFNRISNYFTHKILQMICILLVTATPQPK